MGNDDDRRPENERASERGMNFAKGMSVREGVRGLGAGCAKVARTATTTPRSVHRVARTRATFEDKNAVVKPINGDPYIGMMETPVTSAPIVANFLSNLPAYRTGVAPVLRGVEIGLTHGFFIAGPFIKLGPLRDAAGNVPEVSGCLSGAALVLILTLGLTIYGVATYQGEGGSNTDIAGSPGV